MSDTERRSQDFAVRPFLNRVRKPIESIVPGPVRHFTIFVTAHFNATTDNAAPDLRFFKRNIPANSFSFKISPR